jgi:hypothetical protein
VDEAPPQVKGASLNRALVGTGFEQVPFEIFDFVVESLDCLEISVDQKVEQTVEQERDTVFGEVGGFVPTLDDGCEVEFLVGMDRDECVLGDERGYFPDRDLGRVSLEGGVVGGEE